VTAEDAYAYGKFARAILGTNDVDFRARPHSAEEAAFLASHVVATGPDGGAVTYADLEKAKAVVLVGFEPEDESPIVFLRLRKAFRKNKTAVYAVAPVATRGLAKVGGRLIATAPGTEPEVLGALATGRGDSQALSAAAEALKGEGAIILVGERLATVPGALSAVAKLAADTGARLAWVPRRAGERGALEAGALPTLLPGGRPVPTPPPAPRLPRSGVSPRCPRPPAATPPASWRLPAPAPSTPSSSVGSTRPTSALAEVPTRRSRPPSSSASRSASPPP
jgi:NADH-quinone oxidoreductase subunit G